MDEIVRFISKAELERARLIAEARAIYDSIFPPADAASEQPQASPAPTDTTGRIECEQ